MISRIIAWRDARAARTKWRELYHRQWAYASLAIEAARCAEAARLGGYRRDANILRTVADALAKLARSETSEAECGWAQLQRMTGRVER